MKERQLFKSVRIIFLCALIAMFCLPTALAEESAADGAGWINVLLLGGDSRSIEGGGLTDTIIILSYNEETGEVNLASILRDTWVEIAGTSEKNKINAAHVFGGPELTMETINNAFGTQLEDYVFINMSGLSHVLTALGGIEVDITEAEMEQINLNIQYYQMDQEKLDESQRDKEADYTPLAEYGENVHLNGTQAVAYARIRHIDSDYKRAERQRTVVKQALQRLTELDAMTMVSVASEMLDYVKTNLTMPEIISLAVNANSVQIDSIEQIQIPAQGTFTEGVENGVWSIKPDLEANSKLLKDFMYGIISDEETVSIGESMPGLDDESLEDNQGMSDLDIQADTIEDGIEME